MAITWAASNGFVTPPDPICRTAGCFAGWRALKDGYTQVQRLESIRGQMLINPDTGHRLYADPGFRWLIRDDSRPYRRYDRDSVAEHARTELELTDEEASELFAGENDMARLKHLVDKLCAQPDRSEQSKAKLRETLDDVLAADAVGLWYQGTWICQVQADDRRAV